MFGWGRRIKRAVHEAFGSDKYSRFAANDLDRKLRRYLDHRGGFFIEAGANDGRSQTNTYLFERFLGWRGLLVEAVPELAEAARRNRPKAIVVNAALVADPSVKEVTMKVANLMSIVKGAHGAGAAEDAYMKTAVDAQGGVGAIQVRELRVPARTLTSILEEIRPPCIDLFSLDVEGYEVEVLKGLDLARFRPRYILVESDAVANVEALLSATYERVEQLSYHDYLYASSDAAPAQAADAPGGRS